MQLPTLALPGFPHLQSSLFINKPVLIGILLLFFIVYAIISSILMYHWSSYGMRSAGIVIGESIFIAVSIALLTVAGLAIHYF